MYHSSTVTSSAVCCAALELPATKPVAVADSVKLCELTIGVCRQGPGDVVAVPEVMLASFYTANFPTKSVQTNPMLKLLLTLAAVIAIAAAVPSDTQGLGFQDLQDSDADDVFADLSDELDLDDEVANGPLRRSMDPVYRPVFSSPSAPTPDNYNAVKQCCKSGEYGQAVSATRRLCKKCGPEETSPTSKNGMTDETGKCPNELMSSCLACGICEKFIAATGSCAAKCSAPTRKCKTSGPDRGKCTA